MCLLSCAVAADELYVNCGDEGDYETIQAAINDAVNGDEIIKKHEKTQKM